MMKKKPRILLNLSLKKKNHINKNAIQTYINEISAKEKLNVMAEKKKKKKLSWVGFEPMLVWNLNENSNKTPFFFRPRRPREGFPR